MTKEFADPVPHGGHALAFVLAYAGLFQRDSAERDDGMLLVDQQVHDLYMLKSDGRLAIDVSDEMVWTKTCFPCRAFLVHGLNDVMDSVVVGVSDVNTYRVESETITFLSPLDGNGAGYHGIPGAADRTVVHYTTARRTVVDTWHRGGGGGEGRGEEEKKRGEKNRGGGGREEDEKRKNEEMIERKNVKPNQNDTDCLITIATYLEWVERL